MRRLARGSLRAGKDRGRSRARGLRVGGGGSGASARRPRRPDVLLPENRGYSGGVNAGLAQARGARLILSNADVVFSAGSIRRLLKAIAEPRVGAAAPLSTWDAEGRVRLPPGCAPGLFRTPRSCCPDSFRRSIGGASRLLRAPRCGSGSAAAAPSPLGAVLAARREVFDARGPFRRALPVRVRGDRVGRPRPFEGLRSALCPGGPRPPPLGGELFAQSGDRRAAGPPPAALPAPALRPGRDGAARAGGAFPAARAPRVPAFRAPGLGPRRRRARALAQPFATSVRGRGPIAGFPPAGRSGIGPGFRTLVPPVFRKADGRPLETFVWEKQAAELRDPRGDGGRRARDPPALRARLRRRDARRGVAVEVRAQPGRLVRDRRGPRRTRSSATTPAGACGSCSTERSGCSTPSATSRRIRPCADSAAGAASIARWPTRSTRRSRRAAFPSASGFPMPARSRSATASSGRARSFPIRERHVPCDVVSPRRRRTRRTGDFVERGLRSALGGAPRASCRTPRCATARGRTGGSTRGRPATTGWSGARQAAEMLGWAALSVVGRARRSSPISFRAAPGRKRSAPALLRPRPPRPRAWARGGWSSGRRPAGRARAVIARLGGERREAGFPLVVRAFDDAPRTRFARHASPRSLALRPRLNGNG